MSEPSRTSEPSFSPRQHTAHLLEFLRGKCGAGAGHPVKGRDPAAAVPRQRPPAAARRAAAQPRCGRSDPPPAPGGCPVPTVAERLQNCKGQLARLLAQADKLAELNRIMHAYLPPHFRGHVALVTLDPEGWTIHADSAAWSTRLRYVLPNLQRQLAAHLHAPVPRLRVRVRPRADETRRPEPARRLTVSGDTVATLEVAARNLTDPRLSMAMQRLAEHARKRVA